VMPPPPPPPASAAAASSEREQPATFTIRPFIKYILDLLNNPANRGVIEWVSSGEGFLILDRERFVAVWNAGRSNEIGSLAAVTRQLNTYGFRKKAGDVWCNPNFHRDHPERHIYVVPTSSAGKKRKGEGGSLEAGGSAERPVAPFKSAAFPLARGSCMAVGAAGASAITTQHQQEQLQQILALQQQLAVQQQELAIRQAQVAERVTDTGKTMQKMEAVLMQRQAALEQLSENVAAGVTVQIPATVANVVAPPPNLPQPPALTRSPSALSQSSRISGMSDFSSLLDTYPDIFQNVSRHDSFATNMAANAAAAADDAGADGGPGPRLTTVD